MSSFSKRWGWAILPPLFLLIGANSVPAAQAGDRIRGPIDEALTVTLPGHVRPEVSSATAIGSAEQELPMEHMILTLKPDPVQESALAKLIQDQQDPRSPSYHKFLTPQQYGEQFGASTHDIEKVTTWLKDHGFSVDEVPAGRRSIVFSGTAGAVTSTFGTTIHKLTVGGEEHYANTEEPSIPAALAEVIGGFVKLNDFRHKPSIQRVQSIGKNAAAPQFTYGSSHYLAPADYATIYDLASLYSNKIDGTGQSIAIVARSNISMSDLETFRSEFGLPANNPTVIIASGSDPGFVAGDGDEATLDVQWSGAIAPKATVKLVVASSTATADGVDLSAQYIVNNNLAPVMSVSFGSCEAGMGSGGVAFYNALWQQAAAQGITVLISSGDSGAAGCSSGGATTGSMRGVNGLCSSPYDVCVGGTELAEGSNPGQYWLPGNNSTMGSALSYIPETVWNESGSNGGSGLWAGGGGSSIYFTKPSWQTGIGVPSDGARDVPDVALTAAGHDAYLIEEYGGLYSIAGTSAASPSFAGIMALVNQKMGVRIGNPNATLYKLALLQAGGGAQVFHDTKTGSNTVPGVTGFSATTGYDLASGLGSVDAAVLVNHWTDASTSNTPTLAVVNSLSTLSLATGATGSFITTVTGGGNFKSAVALAVSGAPAGVSVTLSSSNITSPGSGSVTAAVAVSKTASPGSYTLTVTATGGGLTKTAALNLSVVNPSFALTPSGPQPTLFVGGIAYVPLTVTPSGGFNSPVNLTVTGLPTGMTASFSPAALSGTTTYASTMTFAAAQTLKPGLFSVTVTAVGGSLTKTLMLSVTVPTPTFTLTSPSASATISLGGKITLPVSSIPTDGFNSSVNLTTAGLPANVTASFSPATLSGPAAGTSTLTLSASVTAKAGTYILTVTGNGGGVTKTVALNVTIPPASFTLSSGAAAALSIAPGGVAAAQISFTPGTGFASPVSFAASGLPSGVTASFSPATLGGTTAGITTVTFTAASSAKPATSAASIVATGGAITKAVSVTVTVSAPVTLNLTASPTNLSVPRGGSGQSVVMTYVTGPFTSAINLSASGMPAGVQASFNNTTIAAGAGNVITLTIGNSVPLGTYPITVTATGGGLVKSATLQLTVQPQPAFTLGLNNQFITVKAGGPAVNVAMSITSATAGFNSPITLLVAGTQPNISQKFAVGTLTAAVPSTTLTVSAAANASPGIYTVWLAGYTNSLTQMVGLSVTVTR